jgi:hypothetical protein
MTTSRYRSAAAAAAAVLVVTSVLAGCKAPAPAPAQAPPAAADAPPYRPVASIREVMNSVIDPNIDPVWNSVRTVIDNGKATDEVPTTDEQWAEVRRHALVVGEAANLLLMPGRPVAPAGAKASAPGVELEPDQVRALIDKNRDGWNLYAQQFQDTLQPVLAAIDAKDPHALTEAGEKVNDMCETCHQVFWYPNAVASNR